MPARALIEMDMHDEAEVSEPDCEPAPFDTRSDATNGGRAIARSRITMMPETARRVAANEMQKGDVLGVARFAGVQAAKETTSLLPLCDPALVRTVSIDFTVDADFIEVLTCVETLNDVDPRMPAMVAATAATLTIYDMCKSADRTMTIETASLSD